MTLSNASLPLNAAETSRLYWELSRRGAFCVGERAAWSFEKIDEEGLVALALLQSRYDPRLAAIFVDYLSVSRSLNPLILKRLLNDAAALAPACALGEFVLELTSSQEVKELFLYLKQDVRPVPTQLYYRGIYPLGGFKMDDVLSKPLWGFKKWGFLAADPPLLKERAVGARPFLFDQTSRLHVLRELADRQPRFRLRDYLEAIGHSVSRQQALKDLRSQKWIQKRGDRKGAAYFTA